MGGSGLQQTILEVYRGSNLVRSGIRVRSYLIEYVVDDPMKEIKILELKKLID